MSNDFKFHEQIGYLSSALKDNFREECYAKAGGRDFDAIAPFVACMYKVTHDEVVKALEECGKSVAVDGRMLPILIKNKTNMPLMSFPWLFPAILGRIVADTKGGIRPIPADLTTIPYKQEKPTTKQLLGQQEDSSSEGVLITDSGVTHVGDMLTLFHHDEPGAKGAKSGVEPERVPPGPPATDGGQSIQDPLQPVVHSPAEGQANTAGTSTTTYSSPTHPGSRSPVGSVLADPLGKVADEAVPKLIDAFPVLQPSSSVPTVQSAEDSGEEADNEMEKMVLVRPVSTKPSPLEQLAAMNEE